MLLPGLRSLLTDSDCSSCLLAKARRANAIEQSHDKYIDGVFSTVSTDVCQIIRPFQPDRPEYFISFKCNTSGYVMIYPITGKNAVYDAIKQYVHWVSTQFGKVVKSFFCDQGTKYFNKNVLTFFNDSGIILHYTSGYTPPANGVAERLNLTMLNDVRAMLIHAGLPSQSWPEAAQYSVLIRNHIYSSKLKQSPAVSLGIHSI